MLKVYINGELQKIADWFRSNKMAVNKTKTKFIVFRTRGKRVDPTQCELLFNNNEIGHAPQKTQISYSLSQESVMKEKKKVVKSLFCMKRTNNFVTTPALKVLYFVMVHSHISYCLNIYSCANSTTLNKLKIMQKKAIQIVCNANYRDHTGPLFKQQKILPLHEVIKLSVLKFMHKYNHGKLPLAFNEMWITNRGGTT